MGESVHPTATLEVSVSFGRFQNDALSWERWSSFSPNKYLEEVEKCSTPGSVAQKKAYFEAHYKKIAARKAEQSDQEKPLDSSQTSSDEPDPKDHPETANDDDEIHFSCDERPAQDFVPEFSTVDSQKGKVDNPTDLNSQDLAIDEETKGDRDGTSTAAGSSDKKELSEIQVDPESSVKEEFTEVQAQEEPAKESCPEVTEQPPLTVEEAKKAVRERNKSQKPSARSNTQKITPRKKEQISSEEKKKAASPATKSSSAAKLSHFSTPRLSRSTMMSPSQASAKKANGSSLPKCRTTPGGYRKPVPTTLHMSLSLDPENSGASFTTTRKSLIMEKMGDKEIVRRAFKTFQNSFNGLRSSTDGIFSGSQQVPYKESEKKVIPNISTPQKENEGRRKNTEKIGQGGHFGNRANHLSMGSQRAPGVDKKVVSAALPSTSLRSEAAGEKKKQDTSNRRGAQRSQLGAKKKEGQEAQMKNFRQGISSKASPVPMVNQGKTLPKIPGEKGREKIHRQPTSER